MNIIINLVTGRIQDADNDSYERVVIVYVVLAAGSVVVSIGLVVLSTISVDLRRLQLDPEAENKEQTVDCCKKGEISRGKWGEEQKN